MIISLINININQKYLLVSHNKAKAKALDSMLMLNI
nr:MAG TPA: hypothetical protein [Bacteriophage sp.]